MGAAGRRRGSDTKAEILAVALELFAEKGYDATSLRELAERLDITKAALYYHFSSKEEIVRTMVEEFTTALDELIAWTGAQPRTPRLRGEVLLRWTDIISAHGLRMIRFMVTNQHLLRELKSLHEGVHTRLRTLLAQIVDPGASVHEQLRVRMALFSINLAAISAVDLEADEAEVLAAALEIAHELMPAEVSAARDAGTPVGADSAACR
jgi:AcrR family transcriptional regulator